MVGGRNIDLFAKYEDEDEEAVPGKWCRRSQNKWSLRNIVISIDLGHYSPVWIRIFINLVIPVELFCALDLQLTGTLYTTQRSDTGECAKKM